MAHGHIEGYFLRAGDQFRFFVLGGKHRAAALACLGYSRIPVKVRTGAPRVVERGSEPEWPLVRQGGMDAALTTQVFDRYFA